jgi:CDGSH-type Zn-finger protein
MNSQPLHDGSKIRVRKNGPYLVSGEIPLTKQIIGIDAAGDSYKWSEGKKYPSKDNYALCRCGKSSNKPFCDGSHCQ